MPYKSQEYKRSDVFLDNCLVIKIKGQTRFVDEQYNILDNLNDYVGCDQMYKLSFLNNYDENFIQIHDMGHIPYLENLDLSSIGRLILSWVVTIPAGASLTVLFYILIRIASGV